MGGQVFACGLGGGLNGGVPRSFLVEKDCGSGRKVGLGNDDGAVGSSDEYAHFLGVSSPILTLVEVLKVLFGNSRVEKKFYAQV